VLQQMFEVTSIRFHAAMQTFEPLIDIIIDHCRWNPWKCRWLPGAHQLK